MSRYKSSFLMASAAMLALSAGAEAPKVTEGKAAEGDDPYRLLSTIVVTGSSEAALEVAGSVSFLTDADLSVQAQSDVLRILRAVPGVNIQEEDGYGLRPNIGLRGSGSDRSSRVALMEDGVPISPAPYASPSAYYFPTIARMSAIEVTKGPAAILYGPRTTGGAINMFSTPVPDAPSGHGQVMFGTNDRQRAHLWLGGKTDAAAGWQLGGLVEVFTDETDGFKRLDNGRPDRLRRGRPCPEARRLQGGWADAAECGAEIPDAGRDLERDLSGPDAGRFPRRPIPAL